MKRIAILGSTGSIGTSALKVVRNFPGKFRVAALSANSNIDLLHRQIKEFRPEFVCVRDVSAAGKLQKKLRNGVKLYAGDQGLLALAEEKSFAQILFALSGSSALQPLLRAIKCGKQIALANKEALVAAGPLIMKEAKIRGVNIIPVDSEESAIWQCLEGEDKSRLNKIYLTASGGPFRKIKRASLKGIGIRDVLNHPRWKMGKKITVDSATLMNKGLEFLETMFLFGVGCEKIEVLIHPQAVIHSMVEFVDGVVMAQLSQPDMRIPIQYALSYPERLPNTIARVDFCSLKNLDFEAPDLKKFPCLSLAFLAAKELGTVPCVLNAANEVSVDAFLKKKLDFISIPKVIEKVLSKHRKIADPGLPDILEADAWARRAAGGIIGGLN